MRKAFRSLRLAALLGIALAMLGTASHAQQGINLNHLSPNTVVGRIGSGVPGPAQAIPMTTLASQIGQVTYDALSAGLACDDVTDDTAKLNALLASINTIGANAIIQFRNCTSLISGQISVTSGSAYIRLAGIGNGTLDLQCPQATCTVAKILLLNSGAFEFDHLTIKDGGADCATFLQTTNAIVVEHNNHWIGTTAAPNACNDAIMWGGPNAIAGNGTVNSGFQGYLSYSSESTYSKIKRVGVFGNAANSIHYYGVFVDLTSSNNSTLAITGATNASSAVLTLASSRFTATGIGNVADSPKVTISGFTGNWAAANGTWTITATGANTFSIPVNSTTFGAMTGSPVIPDGEMFNIGTSGINGAFGNVFIAGSYELTGYAYLAKMANGGDNAFTDIAPGDEVLGSTLAYFQIASTYTQPLGAGGITFSFYPGTIPVMVGGSSSNATIGQPGIVDTTTLCVGGCLLGPPAASVSNASGQTAISVSGQAANMNIDYLGGGNIYFDTDQNINFRSKNGGTTGAFINSTGLSALAIADTALSTAGAVCNNSSGVLSTTTTVCTGSVAQRKIGQAHIPFVVLSSGTMGNNGAVSGITAVASAYPAAYCYVPAGAIVVASTAGWYYCTFADTTHATLFNNTYTSGTPAVIGSPTSFSTTGPGAYTQTTGSFIQAYALTVAGNTVDKNGSVRMSITTTSNNNANNKNLRANYGSYLFSQASLNSSVTGGYITGFANTGATNRQVEFSGSCMVVGAGCTTAVGDGAVDSTSSQTLNVTWSLATATDTMTIEAVDVELLPGVP